MHDSVGLQLGTSLQSAKLQLANLLQNCYFCLIQKTISNSILWSLVIKYFWPGCFAPPYLLRPGATAPLCPPSVTPLVTHTNDNLKGDMLRLCRQYLVLYLVSHFMDPVSCRCEQSMHCGMFQNFTCLYPRLHAGRDNTFMQPPQHSLQPWVGLQVPLCQESINVEHISAPLQIVLH